MSETIYKYYLAEANKKVGVVQMGDTALGGANAIEFTAALDALSAQNVECIVIDMSPLEVMNSSGMGMLVGGLTHLRKNNIKMRLAGTSPTMTKLFTVTHLDKVFGMDANLNDAINNC